MGRRRPSSGGAGILIILGLLFATATAAYHFVIENRQAIMAFLLVVGPIVLLVFLIRVLSRKSQSAVASVASSEAATDSRRRPFASGPAPWEATADARWVRPTEVVDIGGSKIAGGMFYLGARIALGDGVTGQYAINPSLPSASQRPDVDGGSLPYWPSYAEISPSARRAFLDWMAGGRKSPACGIGYVFLFFYGLEHRFFAEADHEDAVSMYWEVDRLLGIYGENNSFRGYATTFLRMAKVSRGAGLSTPQLSPERAGGGEIDLAVRLHLGERLARSQSLSADDTLMWVLAHPDIYLRTPAMRCFTEFVALWQVRFARRYPRGVAVSTNGNLSLVYRAASGAFEVSVSGPHEKHPDISNITGPLSELRQLVQTCTDDLDAFSRLIGRKPSARQSMGAVSLLPVELQQEATSEAIANFKRDIAALISQRGSANPTAQTLMTIAGIEIGDDGKISGAAADELGCALDRIDVAIEPDRRMGSGVPRADDQVLVFRAPGGGPVDHERAAYRAMKLQIEVAILAAAADGEASHEELVRTIARIRASSELSHIEQARLIAFTAITFKSPPKQARLMRRLNETSTKEREAIADVAIQVIGGDASADANDVKFLERLHKSLGLPQERLYSGLHRAAVGRVDEPVSISEEKRVPGIPIPKTEAPPRRSVNINAARLARRREETEAVSELLAGIFIEEPAATPPESIGPSSGLASIDGLDGPHTELVELLGLRGSMARLEFDRHAREMRLLPDGAIERINDWSFDRFDEPLIEEGEEIIVAPHLRQRISELRENA